MADVLRVNAQRIHRIGMPMELSTLRSSFMRSLHGLIWMKNSLTFHGSRRRARIANRFEAFVTFSPCVILKSAIIQCLPFLSYCMPFSECGSVVLWSKLVLFFYAGLLAIVTDCLL